MSNSITCLQLIINGEWYEQLILLIYYGVLSWSLFQIYIHLSGKLNLAVSKLSV